MMLLHQKSYTCHSGLHYNGKNLYDKAYVGGNSFCSLMKPHLLSGITIFATLTFK